jgi:hypothetical protein
MATGGHSLFHAARHYLQYFNASGGVGIEFMVAGLAGAPLAGAGVEDGNSPEDELKSAAEFKVLEHDVCSQTGERAD